MNDLSEFVAVLRDKTCGELSCDDCNAQREHAADRIECLREALEDVCLQFATVGNGKLHTGGLSALEGAFAALGWDDPQPAPQPMLCDEPGCKAGATGGWPAPGGVYRHTCHKHSRMVYREMRNAKD